MSVHMSEDEQLEQDLAVAAGEGNEAVNMDPEIPLLAGLEEEVAAVATTALEVRP
jgi:hypothetical protein